MLDNDNSTQAPQTTASDAAPPKRIRISALAKELGTTSKALVALINDLGAGPKTASSALDADLAGRVRTAVQEQAQDPTRDAVAAVAGVETVAGQQTDQAPSAPAVLFQAPLPTDTPSGPDVSAAEGADDLSAEPEDVREAASEEAAGAARRRRRRGRRGRGGGGGAKDGNAVDAAEGGASADGAESADNAESADDTESADEIGSPDANEQAGQASVKKQPAKKQAAKKQPAKKQPAKKQAGKNQNDNTSKGGGADGNADEAGAGAGSGDAQDSDAGDDDNASKNTRRRRRRRRTGSGDGDGGTDDPPNTVTHVRDTRESGRDSKDDDGVKGVKGSTRLEARRQRRRDGRETNRRRPPILSEAEFLARREAVDRVMALRQSGDRTQIAVLEDGVLVEHYVTRASATSYVGNVYLGRVQNVLPSMEAAFIDIGKGRNGVLYAGEVNWDAAGLEGKSRAIEQALKSGDSVLVQVTKDPIGHKGARLTSQVSLPGRFLVYVPGGAMTGISRRLPDTERHRLKSILKKIVPEDAGVIVRTAAEGASEEDLTRDVHRLQAEWESIEKKAAKSSSAPTLVHGEPDLAIRVVRDVFNEDFKQLVVQGDDGWKTVSDYVEGVAPDLAARVSKHTGDSDLFHDLRVDEQLMKALDRKVWLPSGGSLVIDRTEAMTVIDVNTGKFVGSGGNLEQTVTRNNLEAAEEIVRQLRLRDVGGIVVIDFIDMVLESNRELVLRRLTECLSRDRTKHQVAEVTSLGLVQMTRKRVGEGLIEAFSDTCEVCHGRGIIVHPEPVEKSSSAPAEDDEPKKSTARRKRGAKHAEAADSTEPPVSPEQRTKALAAMTAIHRAAHPDDELPDGDAAAAAAELELEAVTAVLSGSDFDLAELTVKAAPSSGAVNGAEAEAEVEAEVEAEAGAEGEAEPEAAPERPVEVANTTPNGAGATSTPSRRPRRRRAASRPAGPPSAGAAS